MPVRMTQWQIIMKASLGKNHLNPGRTRHMTSGMNGRRDFPPFVRLEIARYPGDSGFYLLHICENGEIADTHHETLEEALHQAEWELGIQLGEWQTADKVNPS